MRGADGVSMCNGPASMIVVVVIAVGGRPGRVKISREAQDFGAAAAVFRFRHHLGRRMRVRRRLSSRRLSRRMRVLLSSRRLSRRSPAAASAGVVTEVSSAFRQMLEADTLRAQDRP